MTLLRLMLEGTPNERRMLRAARNDGPSVRLREQVLLSVSVGTLITSVSAPSHAAASHAAATAAPGTIASGGIAVLVKWVGIAGLALAAGTSAGFAAGTAWAEKSRPRVVDSADAPLLTAAQAEPDSARHSAEASTAEPLAQTTATLPLPPPRLAVTALRAQRDTSSPSLAVSDEVRLIDEARVALRSGDAAKCLSLMAERRQRFPNGVLSPEAALLRIEALSLSGQRDVARRDGLRFLSQYPTGPLAGRVRVLLGRETGETSDVGTEAM